MTEKREIFTPEVEGRIELVRETAKAELKKELLWLEHNPPANDPYLSSYAYAIKHLLEEDELADYWLEALYPPVKDTVHHHIVGPAEAFNKIVKSLQRQFLYREEATHEIPEELKRVNYPEDLEDKKECLRILNLLLYGEHSSAINAEMLIDLRGREIMSNVEERYKSAGVLLGSYWTDDKPRRVLDVGCSGGVGMAMLLKPEGVNWESFQVVEDITKDSSPVDIKTSRLLDSLAQEFHAPSHVSGIDIWSIKDPAVRTWMESCSFYPSELLNEDRRQRFDKLLSMHTDERMSFYYERDFTDREAPHDLTRGNDKFDMVFISTMFYQLNAIDRSRAIQNALECTAPGGLVVVQDFFDRDDSRMILKPRANWYERPYFTYVLEADRTVDGWHEVFAWQDGRCRKLQLGRDARHILKPLAA